MSLRAAQIAEQYSAMIVGTQQYLLGGLPKLQDFTKAMIDRSVWTALNDGQRWPGEMVASPLKAGTLEVDQTAVREVTFAAQDSANRRLWQLNRIVYEIHPALWDELGDGDEDDVIPAEVFRMLPHPDPFVAFPEPLVLPLPEGMEQRIHGFFVSGRAVANDGYVQVSTHSTAANGDVGLLFGGLVYDSAGKPVMVSPGLQDVAWNRSTLQFSRIEGPVTVRNLIDQIRMTFNPAPQMNGFLGTPEMVKRAISTLIYLCATNADLRPLPARPVKRKPGGGKPVKPSRTVQVGFHIGPQLAAYRRQEYAERGPGSGRTVRPHIRRAHFHAYRVGPGRRQTIVKWLSPMPINAGGKSDGKSTVVGVR